MLLKAGRERDIEGGVWSFLRSMLTGRSVTVNFGFWWLLLLDWFGLMTYTERQ